MARLTLTTESGSTHTIDLEEEHYFIGRSGDCGLQIDDLSLSGQHAKIQQTPEGWELVDLGSTNGSKINGRPLQGSQLLRHDDAVALGDVTGYYTNLADVSRTKELPGARRAEANSSDSAGISTPDNPAALAWRIVTLLTFANIALAIALAVAIILLFQAGA